MSRHRAFIEGLTRAEALMFATYVAGLDRTVFRQAAALIERDRVALGNGLGTRAESTMVLDEPLVEDVPRGVTPLYDWQAEGDFQAEDVPGSIPDVPDRVPEDEEAVPEPLDEDLAKEAASAFLADVVGGDVPGVRTIKNRLNVGQERAQAVRAYLGELART